jgi:hypothetical protein
MAGNADDARGAARGYALFALLFTVVAVAPVDAAAAPEEIQVYTDDVNEPGEFGLEMHINYVVDGFRAPTYTGQLPTHHVLQVTPEFSYGFAKNWDAGLYLLSAIAADGNFYGNGAKLRVKYIAPAGGAFFWGLNAEIGRTSKRVTESATNVEVRPIVGWRGGKWIVAFNPILEVALSGNSREPVFAPALKIARTVREGLQLGIETYSDTGPLHHSPSFNQQDHFVYAVADLQKGAFDLNFGIGRGLTGASEKWVAKMIIGIPFK